jgi:hypothetical protein
MNLQKNIKRILREELSSRIRRRVPPDEMEKEFIESFEDAYRITKLRQVPGPAFLNEILYITISIMMDSFHWKFVTTFPQAEFWYDDIHSELENHYRDRIIQMYHEKERIDESVLTEEMSMIKNLNESTKELLKYKKFFSDFEIPEGGVIAYKDGTTNLDDFLWKFVDMVDYKSDNNYRRINSLLTDLNRFVGVPPEKILILAKLIDFKCRILDKKWGNDVEIGEDSWSDLRADIVSRGEDFYDKALIHLDLIQSLIDEDDYTESFIYSIPFKGDLI